MSINELVNQDNLILNVDTSIMHSLLGVSILILLAGICTAITFHAGRWVTRKIFKFKRPTTTYWVTFSAVPPLTWLLFSGFVNLFPSVGFSSFTTNNNDAFNLATSWYVLSTILLGMLLVSFDTWLMWLSKDNRIQRIIDDLNEKELEYLDDLEECIRIKREQLISFSESKIHSDK